jgi:Tol biopolymer transport system component
MRHKLLLAAIGILVLACLLILSIHRESLGLLAYVQSGDIWIRDLPDGRPLRLTQDGLNSSPRISPSRKWLAFRKGDGQLWIMRNDGESAQYVSLKKVMHFKWAPGLDVLAFIEKGELRTLETGKSESRILVPSPPQEHTGALEFLWSPDAKWLAYEYMEKRDVAEDEWPWKNSIRKVNVESGDSEEIIAYPPPDEEGVPGNTSLAAWVGNRIYLWQCGVMSVSIMADGCPLYFLDFDNKQKELDIVSLLYRDFLAFSPNGRILAVSEGSDRLTWNNKRIKTVNLESKEERVLTEGEITAFSPVWSPDGVLIAYVAGPETGTDPESESDALTVMAKRGIWLMNADGSDNRQVTGDNGYREECPLWLADGRHLLFTRFDAQQNPTLWLTRTDGESEKNVTEALSSYIIQYEEFLDYYGHFQREKLFDLATGRSAQ